MVTVNAPQTQLVTGSVFANSSTATAALTGIYSAMEVKNSIPYYIPLLTGLSGDELTNYSTNAALVQFYTNSYNSLNSSLTSVWTPAYSYIYQVNALLSGMPAANTLTPAIKQQLTGKRCYPCFLEFLLGKSIRRGPTYYNYGLYSDGCASRAPQAQIYQQIIADLQGAQADLNTDYVDATDTTVTTERVRPTKWVATALLARVYLFEGKYDSAEAAATTVINNAATFALFPM